MDDQDQALNPPAEETAETATPAEDQTTEDTQEIVEEETPKKKGAQSRIRELSGEVHSLRDKIAELTTPVGSRESQNPQQNPPDLGPLLSPGEEIDANELEKRMQAREQRILQQASQMADFRSQQAATIARINSETRDVVDKNKELDPDSDLFDQELSDAIYEAVEAKVKSDPTASVTKFVEKQMKLYRRAASREEAGERAEVIKQAAQSAIRPSQNKPSDQKFDDLSIEEMRSRLGYAE
jgi:hypothetical protein